jgi:pilus assembly protein CpaF
LLADPTITEIMVNAADAIWVERGGRLEQHAARFTDDDAIRAVIDRIVAPLGRRIDEASPMVDARLADGSRVNAIIPPLAVRGPALTIRRFSTRVLGTDDLLRLGSASEAMLEFLRVCVASRRNLIVSGGTGSGKTTLLNVLSNLIPPGERLITIEDAAELRLAYPHLVTLEARPANLEGRGAITIRDLVRNALRMRPDRIIVGECRGGEALDMLQAMNTGHEGSLTTVHANTARDALSRLEMMVLMAGIDLPIVVVREQIASAIDLVVHQTRGADGVRRIQSILEVTGNEAGRLQTQEIFRYVQRSPASGDPHGRAGGHFEACDAVPQFYEGLAQAGWNLDYEGFARMGTQCR